MTEKQKQLAEYILSSVPRHSQTKFDTIEPSKDGYWLHIDDVIKAISYNLGGELAQKSIHSLEELRRWPHVGEDPYGMRVRAADVIQSLIIENAAYRAEAEHYAWKYAEVSDTYNSMYIELTEAIDAKNQSEKKLSDWQASQHYRYIGKDGKAVMARDLEERLESAEAEVAYLKAQKAAFTEITRGLAYDAILKYLEVPTEIVRHKKRGTTYRVIGRGRIQTDNPIQDYDEVVVYQSEDENSIWIRPVSEFDDENRFEKISTVEVKE